MRRTRFYPLLKVLTLTTVLTTSLGSSCKDTLKVSVPKVQDDILFFGDASGGAQWFGQPITVDPKTHQVTRGAWPASMPWAERCPKPLADRVEAGLNDSFGVIPLRDSLRGAKNKDFWKEFRENWQFAKALIESSASNAKDEFVKLFSKEEDKQRARILFDWYKTPLVGQDFEPDSKLGFSMTDFNGQVGVKVSDYLDVGIKAKNVALSFVVVSQWGQLFLTPAAKQCLLAAAQTMEPKPTHIVDSVSLGVLFTFSTTATNLSTKASVKASVVDVNAEVDMKNIRLDATLRGEIDPSSYATSLSSLYDPAGADSADKKVLEYFKNFSKSIQTPVLVSGHLHKVGG